MKFHKFMEKYIVPIFQRIDDMIDRFDEWSFTVFNNYPESLQFTSIVVAVVLIVATALTSCYWLVQLVQWLSPSEVVNESYSFILRIVA